MGSSCLRPDLRATSDTGTRGGAVRHRSIEVASEYVAEPIRGSKFAAVVAPAPDEAAAMAVVRSTEVAHAGADHICWAWRLQDGRSRSWDAEEPRGSAGRPILAQLEGHEVVDAVVVVVRYYGGTKLGVGGLMRAYGGTAGMALDRAAIVEVAARVELVVDHAYGDTSAVDAALAPWGAELVDADYADRVRRRFRVDAEVADDVIVAVRDRTAGRVVPIAGR